MKNIRYIIAVFIVYVTQFALAEVQVLSDNEERMKNENNLRYCGFNTSGIDYV